MAVFIAAVATDRGPVDGPRIAGERQQTPCQNECPDSLHDDSLH